MGTSGIGSNAGSQSYCHALPAGVKLLLTLGIILVAGLIPLEHWPAQGLLLALVFVGLSVAGVTMRYLVRLNFAFRLQCHPSVVVSRWCLGIESNCLCVITNCGVPFPFGLPPRCAEK